MTDPSVIYAALLAGRYRGTIYQSDLNADSPYNTYKKGWFAAGADLQSGLVGRWRGDYIRPGRIIYISSPRAPTLPVIHGLRLRWKSTRRMCRLTGSAEHEAGSR
jgi:hypothetical protein